MEILDLRHFSSADLRPLLEEEAKVWAHLLSWDYSASTEMVLHYVDSKILPGYAAVDRGRVLGYAFFVYEGAKGVIGDLFVTRGDGSAEAQQQVREIETRLLTHSIETLQQSPGIHRAETQLLLHESGAVAKPFTEAGFRCHPRLFMQTEIGKKKADGPVLNKEIELRSWAEADYQPAAGLITAAYRGHVDSEINDQYRTVNGSMRFLHNIVRFPGCGVFDPDSSFVAYNRALQMTVGVILCSRIRHDVGHITQVCVLPEYRSHGIGDALMQRSTQQLLANDFEILTLTVTAANAGAVHLYERQGFSTTHVFDAFVWEG